MDSELVEKELKDYTEAVEYYASERIDNIFFNQGDAHALVVFVNIFNYSKEHILIAANNLNNDVTNDSKYIDAIKSFLNRKKTKLDILVTELSTSNNRLFEVLKEYPSQVVIRNTEGKTFTNDKGEDVHFCVADNHMYRLETNIIQRKASCNFNDTHYCTKLKNLFYQAFNGNISSNVDLEKI